MSICQYCKKEFQQKGEHINKYCQKECMQKALSEQAIKRRRRRNMKALFNPNSVYATFETVGDWSGEEETAALQFNKIIDAIYEAAPDETSDTRLSEIAKYAWDNWGSNEKLLVLTNDEIKVYAESWF